MRFMTTCPCGSRVQRIKGDFDAIQNALRMYQQNAGEFPSQEQGLNALVERPEDLSPEKPWIQLMKTVPADPWNNAYHYVRRSDLPEGHGLYSSGKDRVSKSGGNDPDDFGSWKQP